MSQARFSLGRLLMTPAAQEVLDPQEIAAAVRRHAGGDWGEVDEHDRRENELSLRQGLRLLSAYSGRCGKRFWVITEADRSATTILLPEDY